MTYTEAQDILQGRVPATPATPTPATPDANSNTQLLLIRLAKAERELRTIRRKLETGYIEPATQAKIFRAVEELMHQTNTTESCAKLLIVGAMTNAAWRLLK